MPLTYKIEIALGDVDPAPFRIDVSTLDGGDQIPSGAALDYTSTLTDVTIDCEKFRITRGRDTPDGQVNPGEMEFTLFDQGGKYDPGNTAGVYHGLLRPLRKVQVSVNMGGGDADTVIYTGFITEMDYDPVKYRTTLVAKDMMYFLDGAYPVFSLADVVSPRTGHILINAVVLATGWADYSIDTSAKGYGLDVGSFVADGTQSALDLVTDALDTDFGGGFYFSRESVWTWTPGGSGRMVSGWLYEFYQGSALGMSVEGVVNRATVTRLSPNQDFEELPQRYEDTESQTLYGIREITIESPYFYSDLDTAELAQRIVEQRAYTAFPAYAVVIPTAYDDGLSRQLARLDLMDNVWVNLGRPNAERYRVESIEWNVPNTAEATCSLGLSRVAAPVQYSSFAIADVALEIDQALPITRR